jgi:hypothetical protein
MNRRAYGLLAVGLLVAITLLVCSVAPSDARGRVFIGVGVGVPFWYPYPFYGYPYPYPVYSPPVVQSAPETYVEREPEPPAQQQYYWYYCQSAQAYYPYVKECPGGWLQVVPQSPPPSQVPR